MALLTGRRHRPGERAPRSARRWLVAVVSAVSFAIAALPGAARGQENEYAVKAAFLYNFIRFVEWPSAAFTSPDAPFVVCVAGRDPFGAVLDRTLAGKTVDGHPFATRRIEGHQPADGCHVLFVAQSERGRAGAIADDGRRRSILTIGDFDSFASEGGVIAFYLDDHRVRFAINIDSAVLSDLKISANLLALARVVRGAPGS